MQLSTLKKQAQQSTHWRGHTMRWVKPVHWGQGRYIQTAVCKRCNRTVQLLTHPMPNEINIGGEAVALNCEHS